MSFALGAPMPNAPRDDNKAHTIRCNDELWEQYKRWAASRGDSISESLRKHMARSSKGA